MTTHHTIRTNADGLTAAQLVAQTDATLRAASETLRRLHDELAALHARTGNPAHADAASLVWDALDGVEDAR